MPFAGNLRTLPLPDVFQALNNIKATGVLRLRSQPGSRDVVFNQGEIVGVGFLDQHGRDDLDVRRTHLGTDPDAANRHKTGTWFVNAMQARRRATEEELAELVQQQALDQLGNLFAWNQADFEFQEPTPGTPAAELLATSMAKPLAIDINTVLLESARQQDEWAELRARIRDETGQAAAQSSPAMAPAEPSTSESQYHLYLDGEWKGPYPRSRVLDLVQTGEVAPETWSYDPQTQARETLDKVLGPEARRITLQELDTLRQAVRAAENRVAEERAAREGEMAELRGLAGEILRVAHELDIDDPALGAVVGRLGEVISGSDPSLTALAAETVIVSLVRHLHDGAAQGGRAVAAELEQARSEVGRLAGRIVEIERAAAGERNVLETQLAEAEHRIERERESAALLRTRLAAAAEDAARLDEQLERVRREHEDASRVSTARIGALRTPEDIERARAERSGRHDVRILDLERELARARAEHARMLNEVANLQTRLDDEAARHEAELEASRAVASSLSTAPPPAAPEQISRLEAEVARLSTRLAEAEARAGQGSHARRNAEAETERLRRDLASARANGAASPRIVELETKLLQAQATIERLEQEKSAAERQAYELSRQNTQLSVRLKELANQLAAGERRLAELTTLADQLGQAKAEAERLGRDSSKIHEDLQRIRDQATGKLERAQQRIRELRRRLSSVKAQAREARSEAEAARHEASRTNAIAAAAAATATASGILPSGAFPAVGTAALVRTGTLQSHPLHPPTAVTHRVLPPDEPGPPAATAPGASHLTALQARAPSQQPWSRSRAIITAGLAVAVIAIAGTCWLAAISVPISTSARVNAGLVAITAPIAGVIDGQPLRVDALVVPGQQVASISNLEVGRNVLDGLRQETLSAQTRLLAIEESLKLAEVEHARLAREQGGETASPERAALRDLQASRIIDLRGQLDDLRARKARFDSAASAEEERLAALRRATVTSPVGGRVVYAANPASVQPGSELYRIADTESMVIEAELDASWSGRIRPGDPARVRVGLNLIEARVRSVGSDSGLTTGMALPTQVSPGHLLVLLDVEQRYRSVLNPGAVVQVAIADPTPSGLTWLGLKLRF